MGRISDFFGKLLAKKSAYAFETIEALTVRGLLQSTYDSDRSLFDSFRAAEAKLGGIDPDGNVIQPQTLEISHLVPYVRNWTLFDLGYSLNGFWLLSWKQGSAFRLMEFTVEGTQVSMLNVREGIPWPWGLPDNVDEIRFPDFVVRA